MVTRLAPPPGWTDPCLSAGRDPYFDLTEDSDGWVVRGEVKVALWIAEATYGANSKVLAFDPDEPERHELPWQQKVTSTGETWAERLSKFPILADWLNVGTRPLFAAAKLSPRQIEALEWRCMGLTLDEIAYEMGAEDVEGGTRHPISKQAVSAYLDYAFAGIRDVMEGRPVVKRTPGATGKPRGRPPKESGKFLLTQTG